MSPSADVVGADLGRGAAIEAAGIATAAEIDVDTLADRLRDAAIAADATITTVSLVAAWTNLPTAV